MLPEYTYQHVRSLLRVQILIVAEKALEVGGIFKDIKTPTTQLEDLYRDSGVHSMVVNGRSHPSPDTREEMDCSAI